MGGGGGAKCPAIPSLPPAHYNCCNGSSEPFTCLRSGAAASPLCSVKGGFTLLFLLLSSLSLLSVSVWPPLPLPVLDPRPGNGTLQLFASIHISTISSPQAEVSSSKSSLKITPGSALLLLLPLPFRGSNPSVNSIPCMILFERGGELKVECFSRCYWEG